jgi:hypothetical protein
MPHWTFYRRSGDPRERCANGWRDLPRGDAAYALVAREIPGIDREGAQVRACALPFYGRPSHLCEVVTAGDPVPRYVVAHAGDDVVACVLDGRPETILALNRRLQLRLERDNAVDYLYFWLSHQCAGERRSQPLERLDQVRWRVPPGAGELLLLRRHITKIVPKPFRSTGTVELKARVLRGTTLYAETYSVSAHGHVMQSERERPRLWSLPVVDDLLADSVNSQPRFYAGTWDDCVDATSVPDVLECMADPLPAGAKPPTMLLSRSLDCFPAARLYRGIYEGLDSAGESDDDQAEQDQAFRPADDPAGSGLFVLKGASNLYLLDGTREPIFDAIEREPFSLSRSGSRQLDDSLVLEYLGLFCRVLHGSEGPFYPLEEVTDLNVTRAPRARSRRRAADGDLLYDDLRLDEIAAFTRHLTIDLVASDEAMTDCCMQFGSAVFGTKITVQRNGTVRMSDDSPAVSDLPVNWARNTPPFRRRRYSAPG